MRPQSRPAIFATIDLYKNDICFDAYFGAMDPLPEDDEAFKSLAHDYYRTYGSNCSTSLTFYDCAERGFDRRAYLYQQSREIVIEASRNSQ